MTSSAPAPNSASSGSSSGGPSSKEEPEREERGKEGGGGQENQDAVPQAIVGIGASAGGLSALQAFFEALPLDTGMSFVVIVHLDPESESSLAELLQSKTDMPVKQVRGAVSLESNHVYVIPPGRRIEVAGSKLLLSEFEEPHGRRTPVDFFFHSLAAREGRRVGIVLSGGGSDGASGINAIKKAGGLVLVQDLEEAGHDSMPRAAIATGLADLVLPVRKMAARLPALKGFTPELPDDPTVLSESQEESLRLVLERVRVETGYDFSKYKRSTLLRRLRRRMQVRQKETVEDYLSYLQEHNEETEALFKEVLIGVTNFFRDPESFEALQEKVVPELFEGKGADDSVRVWVIGCSTGEEAYSLAMLLEEYLLEEYLPEKHASKGEAGGLEDAPKFQVFASDIDEEGLGKARKGRYPQSIEADVPEERLERFFEEEDDHYCIKQHLRDRVVFAPHNVLRDPPFSEIDLVCCRNLLIYLQPEAQQQIFEALHYALRGTGYLFLGGAETAEASGLFQSFDSEHCIYQAREHTGERPLLASLTKGISKINLGRSQKRSRLPARYAGTGSSADRRSGEAQHTEALEEGAPPSVLVDEHYNAVHLSERSGRYMQLPRGPLTSQIIRLVRSELQMELRSALFQAFEDGEQVITRPIEVQVDDSRWVSMSVLPSDSEEGEPMALVFFNEGTASERTMRRGGEQDGGKQIGSGQAGEKQAKTTALQELEGELERTRGQLQDLQEEYESSREELVAQNEELRSMNEEYKAATEELENSKKELQSANKELENVNQELEEKLEEISRANSDLKNFMAATDVGLLFLGREMQIRRFTPQIQDHFSVRESDLGRPISEITHQLEYDQLEEDARKVLEELDPVEREVRSREGGWYLAQLYPYRTVEDKIDGVVITFVDVTELEEARQKLQELSSQLTRAEQKERRRVAQVLHDSLQQRLYGIQLKVSTLREKTQVLEGALEEALGDEAREGKAPLDGSIGENAPQSPRALSKEVNQEMKEAEGELVKVIQSTRELSIGMSPPVLESDGLKASLEWLRTEMKELYGLEISLTAEKEFSLGDEDLQALLFHVARELLVNVVQHAEIDRASIQLKAEEGELILQVNDEGIGFDPAEIGQVGPGKAFGLIAARERIRQFGGELTIEAEPGEGTGVTVRMPLESSSNAPPDPLTGSDRSIRKEEGA